MSTPVETAIRTHLQANDAVQETIEWSEIMTRLDTDTLPVAVPRRRRRTAVWVAVAAAVVTILLIGVIPLLVSSDGTQPADTVVPTTIADEVAPTTEIPHDLGFSVAWSTVDWGSQGGPTPVWNIVGTSSVLLGVDLSGQLWKSFDGQAWEPIFPELISVSYAADGELVVVAGWLGDGSSAIRVTVDGENWSEVDHTAFPGTQPRVDAVTQGGFVWLSHGIEDGVIGFIVENKLIDVHDAPRFIEGRQLVETSSGITAFDSSRAYTYLGRGEWSEGVDVPISGDRARVGDTILSFDQADAIATCCGVDGGRADSHWSLMASEDGVTWTELSNRLVERRVHFLELQAGSSFWVYGPNIGRGGPGMIDVDSTTILWISRDGTSWQPLDIGFTSGASSFDLGFVHTAGDFIYVHFLAGVAQDWIGRVETP